MLFEGFLCARFSSFASLYGRFVTYLAFCMRKKWDSLFLGRLWFLSGGLLSVESIHSFVLRMQFAFVVYFSLCFSVPCLPYPSPLVKKNFVRTLGNKRNSLHGKAEVSDVEDFLPRISTFSNDWRDLHCQFDLAKLRPSCLPVYPCVAQLQLVDAFAGMIFR